MYKVNLKTKQLEKIDEGSFRDNGIKERQDIQEWIISKPNCLGEELLIIAKEFADFEKTKERFDLLAMDEVGNLVVIENKADDSGSNVEW
jgi:RecB family endonuclease NucS